MENLFKIVLVLHISGGAIGLIAGTINLMKTKGDRLHRTVGKAFLFAMITAGRLLSCCRCSIPIISCSWWGCSRCTLSARVSVTCI
jgi:uncharacterized membrane protein